MASRRTKRLVGGAVILLITGLTSAALLIRSGNGESPLFERGLDALAEALHEEDAESRNAALAQARAFLWQAVGETRSVEYLGFAVTVTEDLVGGFDLPPQPKLYERSLALLARGRPHEARLLLEERPSGRRTPADHLMIRLLDDLRKRDGRSVPVWRGGTQGHVRHLGGQ